MTSLPNYAPSLAGRIAGGRQHRSGKTSLDERYTGAGDQPPATRSSSTTWLQHLQKQAPSTMSTLDGSRDSAPSPGQTISQHRPAEPVISVHAIPPMPIDPTRRRRPSSAVRRPRSTEGRGNRPKSSVLRNASCTTPSSATKSPRSALRSVVSSHQLSCVLRMLNGRGLERPQAKGPPRLLD